MSKKIIAGNWKLYNTPVQSVKFFDEFLQNKFDFTKYDVVFFPSALSLPNIMESLFGIRAGGAGQRSEVAKQHPWLQDAKTSSLQFGVQNFWHKLEGAFTGENSLQGAQELGCQWALIGHSERRSLFHDTNDLVVQKTKLALEQKMKPMVCIGETLQEREAGRTADVLVSQLEPLFQAGLPQFDVAYEPVWAIGTGKVATPEQVAEVHAMLRGWLDQHRYQKTKIVYGGSVKPDNSAGLIQLPHVDGFLVGGASLQPQSFYDIVRSVGV